MYTHEAKKTDQCSSNSASKQTCLDGYTKSVKSQHCSEKRATATTERVVNMIVLDLKPICIVEGEGFVGLLYYLEQYQVGNMLL